MSSAIDDAIEAARLKAAETPNTNVSTTTGGSTEVGATAERGAPLGLDDMLSGAISVDSWIKVGEYGLTIGADRTLFTTLPVTLDLTAIAYCYSVRFGNPAQYAKTYDRMVDTRGRSWAQTLMNAQKADSQANEFRSADIPFVLREDLLNAKKEVIAKAGSTLGHSLSITGWKSFQEFTRQLTQLGLNPRNAVVDFDLGFDVKTNAKGTWGVLAFGTPTENLGDPE